MHDRLSAEEEVDFSRRSLLVMVSFVVANYNSTCRPCRVRVCVRRECASAHVGVVACVVCSVLVVGNMGIP
jgi:hypothetical protein